MFPLNVSWRQYRRILSPIVFFFLKEIDSTESEYLFRVKNGGALVFGFEGGEE